MDLITIATYLCNGMDRVGPNSFGSLSSPFGIIRGQPIDTLSILKPISPSS